MVNLHHLLDIDKAIRIVRDTDEDDQVIPNLMIGFGIDQIQAEFIAEIKLRNLNKEYILKKIEETSELEKQIAELEETLGSRQKILALIIAQLKDVAKKYGRPRKTDILFEDQVEVFNKEDQIEDYPVTVFVSREGYVKKITPQSLRMSGEHKYKEEDGPAQSFETSNVSELLFFTNKCQVYKVKTYEFADTKASALGDYAPSKLQMDEGETVVYTVCTTDYSGDILIFFANGKAARTPLASYETKTNRRKLMNAFNDKSPAAALFYLKEERYYTLYSSNDKILIVNSEAIPSKTTKGSQGVGVMTQKGNHHLHKVVPLEESGIGSPHFYMTKNIPAIGKFLRKEDDGNEQITLMD